VKNLTELKRQIKAGSVLTVVDHWVPEFVGNVRTVTKTQGNGYWFTEPSKPGKRLWGDYPKKAAQVSFPNPDTFRVAVENRFWELRVQP